MRLRYDDAQHSLKTVSRQYIRCLDLERYCFFFTFLVITLGLGLTALVLCLEMSRSRSYCPGLVSRDVSFSVLLPWSCVSRCLGLGLTALVLCLEMSRSLSYCPGLVSRDVSVSVSLPWSCVSRCLGLGLTALVLCLETKTAQDTSRLIRCVIQDLLSGCCATILSLYSPSFISVPSII